MSTHDDVSAAAEQLEEAMKDINLMEILASEEASKLAAAGIDQPHIEGQPLPVLYQAVMNSNFEDRNGFVTGIAKYIEEATVHAALVNY